MRKYLILLMLVPLFLQGQTIITNRANPIVRFQSSVSSVLPLIIASDYGFHPDSSASVNTEAWNSFPEALTVNVTLPGTYEIDTTLLLKSNTTYNFVSGDTIKKTGVASSYTHIFANENIGTTVRDRNINLYGNGLFLNPNGLDNYDAASPLYRMRGDISFYRVDGFVIDGIESVNDQELLFLMHFSDISDFVISNITAVSPKDIIHFNSQIYDGLLENIYTDSYDDALALMVTDWAIGTPSVGDLRNITIKNWTDTTNIHEAFGSSVRINSSSWGGWNLDSTYRKGAVVVNDGRIYIKRNDNAAVAANPPVHTSGSVLYADNIEWDWMQDGTITEGNLENIRFEDCNFYGVNGTAISWFRDDDDPNSGLQVIYPGTEGNATSDSIVFDNCLFACDSVFGEIAIGNYIDTMYFFDCEITVDEQQYFIAANKAGSAILPHRNIIDKIVFDNCTITKDDVNSQFIYKSPTNDVAVNNIEITNSVLDWDNFPIFLVQQNSGDSLNIILSNNTISSINNINIQASSDYVNVTSTGNTYNQPNNIYYTTNTGSDSIFFTSYNDTFTNLLGDYYFKSDASTLLTLNVNGETTNGNQLEMFNSEVDLIYFSGIDSVYVPQSDPNKIYALFPYDLDGTSVPSIGDFSVTGHTISSLSIDSNTCVLSLVDSVEYGETSLQLGYTKPGSNFLISTRDSIVADFTKGIINNSTLYYFDLVTTGTGTGVGTFNVNTLADINATLTGVAKFYTDAGGTLNESSTWNITTGAKRTIYLKCTSGTAKLIVDDITQINIMEWYGTSNNPSISRMNITMPNLLTFDFFGENTFSFNVSLFNEGLTYIRCRSNNALTGDLSGLPSSLTYLHILGNNTLSGDMNDLPLELTYVYILGQNEIADYTSGHVFNSTFDNFQINQASGFGLSSTEVDNLLIDLATYATTWVGSKYVNIAGNNAARTSASDAAVSTLQGLSVTVITN